MLVNLHRIDYSFEVPKRFILFWVFCAVVMGSAWLFAVKYLENETVNQEKIDLGE